MNDSFHIFIKKVEAEFFMEQRLTCANHSDEVVLDQIGWQHFNCPKCGSDYSIGRKIVLLDPEPVQKSRSKKQIIQENNRSKKYVMI